MKHTFQLTLLALLASLKTAQADPKITSWHTEGSRRYARLFQDRTAESAGNSTSTWSRGQGTQTTPTYAGVQSISSSDNWIYIRTSGLGSHVMGPWYLNEAKTQDFPNYPSNTATVYRIPRAPEPATNHQSTGAGAIGFFVDGVAMFDSRDTFSYETASQTDGSPVNGVRGDGVWNRDAYVNEGVTFDAAFAHQAGNQYHYHANPPALRHQLNDHVDYDAATNTYSERTTPPAHSPILAWLSDGYPLYGPYGYSDPTDPNSQVIRMRSGYQKRDGIKGTANLETTGRTTLPAWAAAAQGRDAALPSNLYGPNISTAIPLGHYIEDYDHLSSHGFVQSVDFDLDEHNGRFCVTPEYPEGTYAYFVTIESDGTPKFPYNLGRTFYGNPTGGTVNGDITENVTLEFEGGPNSDLRLIGIEAATDEVTLTWTSVEGGSYQLESTSDFSNWETITTDEASQGASTQATAPTSGNPTEFFRVTLTSVADYDVEGSGGTTLNGGDMGTAPPTNNGDQAPPTGGTATGGITAIPETITRGSGTQQIRITLADNLNPPLPPTQVNPSSITIGGLEGAFQNRNGNTITVGLNLPSDAPAGPQSVSITFPGPGGQTGPSYTADAVIRFD